MTENDFHGRLLADELADKIEYIYVGRARLSNFLTEYDPDKRAAELIRDLDTEFNLNLSLPKRFIADGFDSPVGTPQERAGDVLWGNYNQQSWWFDANPFLNKYDMGYHTGVDLNLNAPRWDSDRLAPVYAPASGTVIFAERIPYTTWGNVIIIKHDPLPDGTVVWSRLAHLDEFFVLAGERVERGQYVAKIGNAFGRLPYHLHFDIAQTDILESDPGFWPGWTYSQIVDNFVDPKKFIENHRPER